MWQLYTMPTIFQKKKKKKKCWQFISLRATLCTEPVLGQVIVETTRQEIFVLRRIVRSLGTFSPPIIPFYSVEIEWYLKNMFFCCCFI